MRIFLIGTLLALTAAPAFADAHKPGHGKRTKAAPPHAGVERQIRLPDGRRLSVLKPEYVRDLKILPVPDQPQTAIQIGVYWQCMPAPGDLETCDLLVVACTDNGEFCTELP